MKVSEVANSMALFVATTFVVAFCYVAYRISERVVESIHPVAFTVAGTTILFSLVFVTVSAAKFIIDWMSIKARQIHPKGGLYPQMHYKGQYVNLNEEGAQRIAALSGTKLSPSAVAKVVDSSSILSKNDPALIPGPAAPEQAALSISDVMEACDPKNKPHWLLIGSTGSGKTSASYQILSQLKQMHRCEFVIAERGGVNWGLQTTATTTEQIAALILEENDEMERRMELLRQHDVYHVSDLPQPKPYRVILMEEMDAVFDELKLTDRALRTKTLIALKNIARMGRKAGVCLMAVSQSGTVDVFDAHVRRNLGNVLLFNSEHTVANTWQIGERLNNLPVGMAYSVGHGGFVQFDRTARPQLAAINGSCGPIRGSNAVAPVAPVVAEFAPVVAQPEVSLPRLARGCEPDEQLAEQLRQLIAEGYTKTELCRRVWGYKDGGTLGLLNNALAQA